jgi:hypothetical protein
VALTCIVVDLAELDTTEDIGLNIRAEDEGVRGSGTGSS